MSDDYLAPPLSNEDVWRNAKALRIYYGLRDTVFVDVLACFSRAKIWTVHGERPLRLDLRSDETMGPDDAFTSYVDGVVVIAAKRSVRHDAFMGVGKHRNTFAHELGHGVLHATTVGAQLARRSSGNKTPSWIKPYESAEHQAKIFAPSFLINDDVAKNFTDAKMLSVQFGVSTQSAQIYLDQISEPIEREKSAKRVMEIANEFRTSVEKPRQLKTTTFLSEHCPNCSQQRLFPVGSKFMCQNCDYVTDLFQDGDGSAE